MLVGDEKRQRCKVVRWNIWDKNVRGGSEVWKQGGYEWVSSKGDGRGGGWWWWCLSQEGGGRGRELGMGCMGMPDSGEWAQNGQGAQRASGNRGARSAQRGLDDRFSGLQPNTST